MNTSTSGGGGSGSSYNYIYSKPFGNPGGYPSSQGGPYDLSRAQQGALQNLVNTVHARTFDAQAFVSALQGVVSVFSVK